MTTVLEDRTFSTDTAAGLAGVHPAKLHRWATAGVLSPALTITGSGGQGGVRRAWSADDVVVLAAAARLAELGAPLDAVRVLTGHLALALADGELELPALVYVDARYLTVAVDPGTLTRRGAATGLWVVPVLDLVALEARR